MILVMTSSRSLRCFSIDLTSAIRWTASFCSLLLSWNNLSTNGDTIEKTWITKKLTLVGVHPIALHKAIIMRGNVILTQSNRVRIYISLSYWNSFRLIWGIYFVASTYQWCTKQQNVAQIVRIPRHVRISPKSQVVVNCMSSALLDCFLSCRWRPVACSKWQLRVRSK